MYDLHMHSTFSDGVLIPSELLRRAEDKGYKGIAITDHVDFSNYQFVIENLLKLKSKINNISNIKFLAGIEITHVIPRQIPLLAEDAKNIGADLVVVHGETIVEPVAPDTNYYAVNSSFVDILAHPGLIEDSHVKSAVENDVFLEITTRKGHSLTNGYVFQKAKKFGAKIVLNNDAHTPSDIIHKKLAEKIVYGCGGNEKDFEEMLRNSKNFFEN